MRSAQDARSEGLSVVFGAGSPLGDTVVRELISESKQVTAVFLEKAAVSTEVPDSVEKVRLDPSKTEGIAQACRGAGAIYGCCDPGYGSLQKLWPVYTSNLVYAAIEVNALLVFASHVNNSESDNATIEGEILNAHLSNLTSTVVARVPQLYGRRIINPLWKLIYDSVLAGKKAHWVGNPDVPRSLLDVEDAARAMVCLAGSPRSYGKGWNVANPEHITGRKFAELAFRAVGREPNVGSWGRGILLTGGPLSSDARDVLKMPYDYYSPFVLDGTEFAEAFPSFRFQTPEESISKGVAWYREQNLVRLKG